MLQLLPDGMRLAVGATFEMMEIAEQAILDGKRTYPKRAAEINACFSLLQPPAEFHRLDTKVYRSHTRELVLRAAYGWEVKPELATRAEILVCLMEQSLKAPLATDYAALYEWLFPLVMEQPLPPGEAARFTGTSGHTQASLFETLRKKCNRRHA